MPEHPFDGDSTGTLVPGVEAALEARERKVLEDTPPIAMVESASG